MLIELSYKYVLDRKIVYYFYWMLIYNFIIENIFGI